MIQLSACPVCGSDSVRFSFNAHTTRGMDKNIWAIYVCDKCGHGFLNPQPTWEELNSYYNASYDPYTPSHGAESSDAEVVQNAKVNGEFRHVRISEGIRILDVGCGAGYFLRIASQLGAIVQGVEPSPIGGAKAREMGIPVFVGTVEEFAVAEERRFELITLNHVLEHTSDPVMTLRILKSLLAPGGMIWVSVPNANCVFSRKLRSYWHSIDIPYHLMQFTSASLSRSAELAGLSVKSTKTYSLSSATAASLRAVLRRKYLIPERLSLKISLIDSVIAPRLAKYHDSRSVGEALIAEFGHL